jgi:phosphopantetheinyl transferase
VPLSRDITHPHKRLQHLAGRYLLQYLYPDFPYELIRIADTRKPFLANEAYHFSISHCGDYAAVIVSETRRVGIDIEIPRPNVERIRHKFLTEAEETVVRSLPSQQDAALTLAWSAKEAVYKWYGYGGIDFRGHIQLQQFRNASIECLFTKEITGGLPLELNYKVFEGLVLVWVDGS